MGKTGNDAKSAELQKAYKQAREAKLAKAGTKPVSARALAEFKMKDLKVIEVKKKIECADGVLYKCITPKGDRIYEAATLMQYMNRPEYVVKGVTLVEGRNADPYLRISHGAQIVQTRKELADFVGPDLRPKGTELADSISKERFCKLLWEAVRDAKRDSENDHVGCMYVTMRTNDGVNRWAICFGWEDASGVAGKGTEHFYGKVAFQPRSRKTQDNYSVDWRMPTIKGEKLDTQIRIQTAEDIYWLADKWLQVRQLGRI